MSKILENTNDYSEKVTDRIIELINQNKLNYSNELQLIEVLFQKYELISIFDYATKINKSYNRIKDMIERKKLAIINNLN